MPPQHNTLFIGKTEANWDDKVGCGEVGGAWVLYYQSKCYATDYTVLRDLACVLRLWLKIYFSYVSINFWKSMVNISYIILNLISRSAKIKSIIKLIWDYPLSRIKVRAALSLWPPYV